MNKTLMMSVVFGVAGLMSGAQLTLADSQCQPHDYYDGKPYFKRAEAAEQAGRFKDAYKEYRKAYQEAVKGGSDDDSDSDSDDWDSDSDSKRGRVGLRRNSKAGLR